MSEESKKKAGEQPAPVKYRLEQAWKYLVLGVLAYAVGISGTLDAPDLLALLIPVGVVLSIVGFYHLAVAAIVQGIVSAKDA